MPPRRTRTPRVKTAKIGRFDGELHEVVFNQGDTIKELLEKADLQAGSGVEINDEQGNTMKATEQAKDKAVYYLTGNYKNGTQ